MIILKNQRKIPFFNYLALSEDSLLRRVFEEYLRLNKKSPLRFRTANSMKVTSPPMKKRALKLKRFKKTSREV